MGASTIDFESIWFESSAEKVILLTYLEEPEIIKRYFVNFAKTKVGSNYTIVEINSLGLDDNKQIKRTILKAMEEVGYFVNKNK
jgi:hypothetical protein